MYVYIVKHPQKGVIYVGKTNEVERRMYQHFYLRNGEILKAFRESAVYYVEEYDEKEAANLEAVLIHGLKPEYNIRNEIVRHDIGWLELKQRNWKEYNIPGYFKYGNEGYMNIIIENLKRAFEEYERACREV